MKKHLWVSIILIIFCHVNSCSVYCLDDSINNNAWMKMGTTLGLFLRQCLIQDIENKDRTLHNFNPGVIIKDCVKNKGIHIIDRALNRDVIEISRNVFLLRKHNSSYDNSFNNSQNNHTSRTFYGFKTRFHWTNVFYDRILQFFKNRILKIKMNNLKNIARDISRRKKNDGFGQLLLFGLVAAGFILIPLGFQFLAVLGGKALLLAKLALILSSIQGLKKIATSNMNYGLYSTGGNPGTSWYYDRQWSPESVEPLGYSVSSDSLPLGSNRLNNILSKSSSD